MTPATDKTAGVRWPGEQAASGAARSAAAWPATGHQFSVPCVFLANRFDRLAGGHQALLAPANHVSATSEGATARDGLFVAPDNYTTVHRKLILDLAARYQLSAIYAFRYFVADGGLVSYGVDPIDPFREAAGYVDRILRGEKPADLPVQQPTKFELLIDPDGRHDWHHSF